MACLAACSLYTLYSIYSIYTNADYIWPSWWAWTQAELCTPQSWCTNSSFNPPRCWIYLVLTSRLLLNFSWASIFIPAELIPVRPTVLTKSPGSTGYMPPIIPLGKTVNARFPCKSSRRELISGTSRSCILLPTISIPTPRPIQHKKRWETLVIHPNVSNSCMCFIAGPHFALLIRIQEMHRSLTILCKSTNQRMHGFLSNKKTFHMRGRCMPLFNP